MCVCPEPVLLKVAVILRRVAAGQLDHPSIYTSHRAAHAADQTGCDAIAAATLAYCTY
jgi:hypothetical protein